MVLVNTRLSTPKPRWLQLLYIPYISMARSISRIILLIKNKIKEKFIFRLPICIRCGQHISACHLLITHNWLPKSLPHHITTRGSHSLFSPLLFSYFDTNLCQKVQLDHHCQFGFLSYFHVRCLHVHIEKVLKSIHWDPRLRGG